jgi:hypothetical protein
MSEKGYLICHHLRFSNTLVSIPDVVVDPVEIFVSNEINYLVDKFKEIVPPNGAYCR